MTTVVTGWTGRGYDALGEQFGRTFEEYWPSSVPLWCYGDDSPLHTMFTGHHEIHLRPLWECAGLADFIARHKDNPEAHGRGSPRPGWREKDRRIGYSWRFDAAKFALQLFVPEAAAKHLPDGEILVWFDADVLTHRDVPEGFIEGLIGDNDICYLGREPKHSEIGFWAVRLSPLTRAFLSKMPSLYRSDMVFQLREWHSAFVFDAARAMIPMKERNLTPGGSGHVWHRSPLGRYLDHLKGDRKALGRSPERRAA